MGRYSARFPLTQRQIEALDTPPGAPAVFGRHSARQAMPLDFHTRSRVNAQTAAEEGSPGPTAETLDL